MTERQDAARRRNQPLATAAMVRKAKAKQARLRALLLANVRLTDAARIAGYHYDWAWKLRRDWKRDDPVFRRRLEDGL